MAERPRNGWRTAAIVLAAVLLVVLLLFGLVAGGLMDAAFQLL